MNAEPFVPVAFELGVWGMAVLALALVVAALISIHRSRVAGSTEQLIWTLVVIFLPFLGPILWFAYLGSKRKGEAT